MLSQSLYSVASANSIGYLCCITSIVCQESFDGQMTEDNIEIGISNASGFRKLQPSDIQDYLATIQ